MDELVTRKQRRAAVLQKQCEGEDDCVEKATQDCFECKNR